MKKYIATILSLALLIPALTAAQSLGEQLRGAILLQVEENGEAWYVHPSSYERFFLNRPADAFEIMRSLGVGIANADLERIPISLEHNIDIDTDGDGLSDAFEDALGSNKNVQDTDGDGFNDKEELQNQYNPNGAGSLPIDSGFTQSHSGKIFLQVQNNGEAWYINPSTNTRYFLGRPDDAFNLMRTLGLGISNTDINKISIAVSSYTTPTSPDTKEAPQELSFEGIVYEEKDITVQTGTYTVLITKIPKDTYEMVTLTGQNNDCFDNCTAKTLEEYVQQAGGSVGIHGSYFCPPDYSECGGSLYTYLMPFLNSQSGVMVNEYKMPFHEGPMVVYNTQGEYELYHRPLEIGWTKEDYTTKFGKTMKAAASNYPSLIEDGVLIVDSEPTFSGNLKNNKSPRGGLGWDSDFVYMFVAKSATVKDLGLIAQSMGLHNAINLDGGGTTAMYVKDQYVIGPGRLLPNAIVFKKK